MMAAIGFLARRSGAMGQKEQIAPLALIVEDDADERHLAAALLEETDLHVIECESAEAALSVMQRCGERILLVFVDIRLPGIIDGVDLARVVRMHWPHARVIVTSGNPGDRLDHLPHEAAYMQKPWRALDVLIAAEEALAARPAAA
jgi:DNA-binding NtrC family response regulator